MTRLLLLWLLLLPATALAGGLQDQISKTYIDPNITGYPTANLPANATRGQLAFDTTTNQLKVYNGSAWVASSGGGASTSDHFVTTTSDGDVANSTNLGALSTGYIKCTVSGGICTVSSDATVATAASTTTFTNKTLDCNGTGNSCLNFPGGAIGGAIGSSTHNKILYTDNTGLLQELTLANGQVPTASSGSIVAGTIDAAPSSATFIMQTPNSGTSAEQALSSLASGCLSVTTGTGVIASSGAACGGGGTDTFVVSEICGSINGAPAASTTYWLWCGAPAGSAFLTDSTGYYAIAGKPVPVASTLVAVYYTVSCYTGSADNTHAVTVKTAKAHTTTMTTTGGASGNIANVTAANPRNDFSETGLSVSYAAGDLIGFQLITPASYAGPTSCMMSASAKFTNP